MNEDDLAKQIQQQNQKRESEQVAKEKQRKLREMEAKFFQDNQILAKKEMQKLRQQQKVEEAEAIALKVKEARLQDEQEKEAKKQKYRDHLQAMKEQSSFPKSNYLAKTGVAIIKNNPMDVNMSEIQSMLD